MKYDWDTWLSQCGAPLEDMGTTPLVPEQGARIPTTMMPPLNQDDGGGSGEMFTPEQMDQLLKGTGGRKDDTGKVRMDLLPPELLTATATILTFGAKKYNARNWEQGMSWGRVFGALMRHMWAWWKREDKDEETGYSHLWHAACCIAFLIAYEERKIGEDDRATR